MQGSAAFSTALLLPLAEIFAGLLSVLIPCCNLSVNSVVITDRSIFKPSCFERFGVNEYIKTLSIHLVDLGNQGLH